VNRIVGLVVDVGNCRNVVKRREPAIAGMLVPLWPPAKAKMLERAGTLKSVGAAKMIKRRIV
jgi:hypothetical protein